MSPNEILIGGDVTRGGVVLSPEESKAAVAGAGGKQVVINFTGNVYGMNDFRNVVRNIFQQEVAEF